MSDTPHNFDTLPLNSGETSTAFASRYDILEELGRGGMGVVYRGRHRQLDKPVAIKFVNAGVDIARFLREARLLAKVDSPHVVRVHDFDVPSAGAPMLVMELIEGSDLREMIEKQKGPLDEAQVLPWMCQVAEGLLAAAEKDIIHRDIKPSNIRIDSRVQARVMDFGLSRVFGDSPSLTLSDSCLGTPHYMAPEQAECAASVDTRADIYSFGATFYHSLTGRPPFEGRSAFAVLFKHKTEPLIDPRSLNSSLSRDICEVLLRCLEKSPDQRFSSFGEVLEHLRPTAKRANQSAASRFDISPYLDRYQRHRQQYLDRTVPSGIFHEYVFPGGPKGRKLKVSVGDIMQQEGSAIISPVDSYLATSNAVSSRITQAAGESIERLVAQFRPALPGRVIVTPGGNTPFAFIFHAVTHDAGFMHFSHEIVSDLVPAVLFQADSLLLPTITMPVLGGPSSGLSDEMALDVMFFSLARELHSSATCVRTVHLVLEPKDSSERLDTPIVLRTAHQLPTNVAIERIRDLLGQFIVDFKGRSVSSSLEASSVRLSFETVNVAIRVTAETNDCQATLKAQLYFLGSSDQYETMKREMERYLEKALQKAFSGSVLA